MLVVVMELFYLSKLVLDGKPHDFSETHVQGTNIQVYSKIICRIKKILIFFLIHSMCKLNWKLD